MREPEDHFLLVGNGPYANRGCEAIVRGTMEILRGVFGEDTSATVVSFAPPDVVARQAAAEFDAGICHLALNLRGERWSRDWMQLQMLKFLHPRPDVYYLPRDLFLGVRNWPYRTLDADVRSAGAVLEIGGDNYSLEYGWPERFLALDRYVQRRGRPLLLWGASVGPFDAAPPQAQAAMFRHLSTMRAVFVRESASLDYLQRHAVPNVFLVADPAFAMAPQEPDLNGIGSFLSAEAIGMNFSPLMAQYVTGGDLECWGRLCSDIVQKAIKATGRQVLLIPHVSMANAAGDDHVFLREVMQGLVSVSDRVQCLPDRFSAAELKWVISQCAAFVGARTHSTIAALSSGVPTLSLAYSRKAYGINQDLFDSQEYCLPPAQLSVPDEIVSHLVKVLKEADSIRRRLREKLPGVVRRAQDAGLILRQILSDDASVERRLSA